MAPGAAWRPTLHEKDGEFVEKFWQDIVHHTYNLMAGLSNSGLPNENTMKKIIATMALAILAFAPAAMAEEVAYVAGMTGVV